MSQPEETIRFGVIGEIRLKTGERAELRDDGQWYSDAEWLAVDLNRGQFSPIRNPVPSYLPGGPMRLLVSEAAVHYRAEVLYILPDPNADDGPTPPGLVY